MLIILSSPPFMRNTGCTDMVTELFAGIPRLSKRIFLHISNVIRDLQEIIKYSTVIGKELVRDAIR